MKTLLIILSLVVSMSSFADESYDFYHGENCKNERNGRESRISMVSKTFEDHETVSFRMIFTHGLCNSINRVQSPIKFQKKMIQISNYGLNLPFKKIHAEILDYKPLSENELEVEISVAKKVLDKSRNSKRFILDFWAGDWIGYPWVMTFKRENGDYGLSFQGFKRL